MKKEKLAHIMFVVQPACQQKCGCKLECKEVTKPTVAFSSGFKENMAFLVQLFICIHSRQRNANNSCNDDRYCVGAAGLMFCVLAILGHPAAA